MPAAGSTGELYKDADNPASVLGTPPAPPTDVPPPTKVQVTQPVTTKSRMADERPDGSIKDTSAEALRPGNDLGFRNLDAEPKPKETPPEPPKEAAPEPPKEAPAPPPVEKVYAGKFKSVEELEKAYKEVESAKSRAFQEKAEIEKRQAAPPPPPKTPQQLVVEQEEANRVLNDFVSNPKQFLEQRDKKIMETTMVALQSQKIVEEWRKANPDLVEHEIRVAFEATLLAQSDPDLAQNQPALFQKATDNFRQFTGRIRQEGAKEALTQETRTIPLLSPSSTPQATEQPAKAPLTPDEAFNAHMRMLKESEQRSHRGLRR